jgi:hypothetical protein
VPHRNRVDPFGELRAVPDRGLVFGNRGNLHGAGGAVRCRHRDSYRAWIACRLEFKGRKRELLGPGRYTELFFLDDATALAAGHRPCAECRRADYDGYVAAWPQALTGRGRAGPINDALHAERVAADGGQRRHEAAFGGLPDGAFVVREGEPWLVHGDRLRRWTPGGYAESVPRPAGGTATVATPPSSVAVLEGGWRPALVPFLHPSADAR